ncbi:TPA_asm: penton [Sheep rumen MELD virus]|nr:TPA_asm: penton [Sheep rumen MELD virus]
MTEQVYKRVNITSAADTPRKREDGERYVEMSMDLPTNLIPNTADVKSVRMKVMKANIPMNRLPFCTMHRLNDGDEPVIPDDPSKTLNLAGKIGVTPDTIDPYGRYIHYDPDTHLSPWAETVRPMTALKVLPLNADFSVEGHDESWRSEYRNGYHEFYTFSELLQTLNAALSEQLSHSFDPEFGFCPQMKFELNENGTLTLRVTPRATTTFLPDGYPVQEEVDVASGRWICSEGLTIVQGGTVQDALVYSPCSVFVNEALKNILSSLPWIESPVSESVWKPGGVGDSTKVFLLDTKKAKITLGLKHLIHLYQYDGTSTRPYQAIEVYDLCYNFPESYAASCRDVSAIALTLRNVSFPKQIFPVNIGKDLNLSQVTTVPIVDLFYLTDSEHLNLDRMPLVSEIEDFTNSGPITMDPGCLEIRNMVWKVYYITKNGDMRELVMSAEDSFTLQVMFEIFFVRDGTYGYPSLKRPHSEGMSG